MNIPRSYKTKVMLEHELNEISLQHKFYSFLPFIIKRCQQTSHRMIITNPPCSVGDCQSIIYYHPFSNYQSINFDYVSSFNFQSFSYNNCTDNYSRAIIRKRPNTNQPTTTTSRSTLFVWNTSHDLSASMSYHASRCKQNFTTFFVLVCRPLSHRKLSTLILWFLCLCRKSLSVPILVFH